VRKSGELTLPKVTWILQREDGQVSKSGHVVKVGSWRHASAFLWLLELPRFLVGPALSVSGGYTEFIQYHNNSGEIDSVIGYFSRLENEDLNLRLMEGAKLGPAIFLILFTGIVGNTIRLVTRRKAERGSTIEVLNLPLHECA